MSTASPETYTNNTPSASQEDFSLRGGMHRIDALADSGIELDAFTSEASFGSNSSISNLLVQSPRLRTHRFLAMQSRFHDSISKSQESFSESKVVLQADSSVAVLEDDFAHQLSTDANRISDAAYLVTKRLIDVIGSIMIMILLSPILILTALFIKLTDFGSVFYSQTRVGEGGNEFQCYKFRSMVPNADKMQAEMEVFSTHEDTKTFKILNDPRVTWIGKLIRRASLDEFPQLLNVLKGEMSLVGPRPPVIREVEKYTIDDMQRLLVKPGLTCIWQVSGRSRIPFPEQLKMDMEYIEKRSLLLDLKLIAKTVPAVLTADGAY